MSAITQNLPRVAFEEVEIASPPLHARPIGKARPTLSHIRILQGIAILLVVYAHAVIPGHRFTGGLEVFDRFVRACCVPLFICLSGFLYRYTNGGKKAAGFFLKERVLRLLVPYFCLSSLAFVVKASLGSAASRPLPYSWASYAHQLLYPWDNAVIFFWFIPTLTLICVVSLCIDKWLIQKRPAALFPLLAVLAALSSYAGINQITYPVRFFNLYGALNYLFYFWAGFALCRYEVRILSAFRASWKAIPLLAAAITLAIAAPNADHAMALLEASLGCLAMLVITKKLAERRDWPALMEVGDLSYQIYLLSWFFQTMPILLFSHFVSSSQYACALMSLLLGVAGPISVVYAVRRWAPFARPLIGLR